MSELAHGQHSAPINPKRSRRTLYGIILVFVLPIVLAWLVLRLGWFESGVLSHGEWVDPAVQLTNYPEGKWSLAQVNNGRCDEGACQQQLQWLDNVWQGLGAAKLKSQTLVLDVGPSSSIADNTWQGLRMQVASNQLTELKGYSGQWLIVDPTGLIILSYSQMQNVEDSSIAMGLNRDLKKLIKNSRYQ